MRIALTGAGGFLGLHTQAAARSLGYSTRMVGVGSKHDWRKAADAVTGSDRLIHLAGVNRGSDADIRNGNLKFARQLADDLVRVSTPPLEVVYANSIQAGNGSVYGQAKAEAAEILQAAAETVGARFSNVLLPNLFGEHGRPYYNSVVATFCYLLQRGKAAEVFDDKTLELLHAQDAADLLLGYVPLKDMTSLTVSRKVSAILRQLHEVADIYREGDIPALTTRFDLCLFNTYRSFGTQPSEIPFTLFPRADERGSFFEVCRSHGGEGQTSFSATVPGGVRGEHYHRRKVERFEVLSGKAEIAMRFMLSNDVLRFEVDGSVPVAIDMPTLWTHKITNTGTNNLYTIFWASDIFDPARPDTFSEKV